MTSSAWPLVRLDDVARLDVEKVVVLAHEEYRLAGVSIAGGGLFSRQTIAGSETNYPSLNRLRTGQLVMRKLTAWEGPVTTVTPEFDGAFVSNEFPTFTMDEERLLPAYMRVICQWPRFHTEMRLRSTGTAERRSRLDPDGLLSIAIPLPPLGVQRRIVAAATAAERAARSIACERDAAVAVLGAAIDNELAPDGNWDVIPAGWKLKTLADVSNVRSGITKGRATREPVEAVPYLRVANVQAGYLDLSEMKTIEVTVAERVRFRLEAGDVLMIEGGNAEHLGRGWMWEGQLDECLHQNHVFRARPDRSVVDSRFLAYAIAAAPARAYCFDKAKKTVNLASINKTQISAMPVAVAPLDQQRLIADRLDSVRALAVAADEAFGAVTNLHRVLIDNLVLGARRLRESHELASV